VIPIWGFLAVTVPLVLTPGASTAVVLRNSLAGGTRAGLATAVGANAGSLCYGVLCAFGFAVVLQRWPTVWFVLRGGGVIYLAWLGVQSMRRAFGAGAHQGAPLNALPSSPLVSGPVRDGFMTNVANPAIASYYLVILPQFIPQGAPIVRTALLLTAVHIGLAVTWHAVWATAGGALSRALTQSRSRRILDFAAGLALLALAVKLAFG
jgi:threonine/homoserine/homoserine lactone efflux protein